MLVEAYLVVGIILSLVYFTFSTYHEYTHNRTSKHYKELQLTNFFVASLIAPFWLLLSFVILLVLIKAHFDGTLQLLMKDDWNAEK